MTQEKINTLKTDLVHCIHFLHNKGWAPATSSNYSFHLPHEKQFHISASGIEKGAFQSQDLMIVDLLGKPIDDPRKPSAETLLHAMIYKHLPHLGVVLHTHSVFNTVVSTLRKHDHFLKLEGFEMLKGLNGIKTHDTSITIPVFHNSQHMEALVAEITSYWANHPDMRAFLLAGHGMYTWGSTVAEAKRHVEVLEFLFECYYRINRMNSSF